MKKFYVWICFAFISCNQVARTTSVIKKTIECEDCLVTKEETAVGIAESVLFESYGKDMIEGERPYKVSVENDSIWHLQGTFWSIGFGGVFEIDISAKDGRVINMIHGK
ncbi:NTF2 fold immunity protein [Flavobacterium aestuarii]|uniref:NTF2 fold immunity protein n=1 Tax=Flavobacterium aestuarii TaxID=3149227 RepID=UPI0032B48A78